jgi:hypothetical protein
MLQRRARVSRLLSESFENRHPGVRWEVQGMGKWREAFEYRRPSAWDVEHGYQYTFGPPASEEQLAAAELQLGVTLPSDVREMLAEFNGVWYTSANGRRRGNRPHILYLDIEHMTVNLPRYFRTCGNVLPSDQDLRKVAFVCQNNGFADLWGVCIDRVRGFRAGEVVMLDHEIGELQNCPYNLYEFVQSARKGLGAY